MGNQILKKISDREQDVMRIIWRSDKNLTASEIASNNISINTVQAALRNLVKKGYLEVADIVYSGTVLTRSYRPLITSEQFALDQLNSFQLGMPHFSVNLVDNLYAKAEDKEAFLNELENLIKQKKQQIKKNQ